MTIRSARAEDAAALAEIERASWTTYTSPAPMPAGDDFFHERTDPENVLVAESGGRVVGWGKLSRPTPLLASEHVWQVTGLAVEPEAQARGVGAALLAALADEARRRGGRRLTLRVFAPNERARRLYERLGFEVEGVLRGEFRIGDEFVDDVLMALELH